MKLMPLKDLLALSKEKINTAMAPIRANLIKSKATLKKAEIDNEILAVETEIQEMCIGKDLDLEALIRKLDKVAILERRQIQYDRIVDELFPSGVEGEANDK